MPGLLFDTNVWIAAVFSTHPLHKPAQQALHQATKSKPAVFCRSTEQSFLRLATTPALQKAYGAEGLNNRDAWAALDALQTLPQVCTRDEPPGLPTLWRTMSGSAAASPKLWMDAYLAAFAIAGGLRMVTLDRDFRHFEAHRLDLSLIGSAPG